MLLVISLICFLITSSQLPAALCHPRVSIELNPSSLHHHHRHLNAHVFNSERAHNILQEPLQREANVTTGAGKLALGAARHAAAFAPNDGSSSSISSLSSKDHHVVNKARPSALNDPHQHPASGAEQTIFKLSCDSSVCKNLVSTFVGTVEGSQCRSIFKTGKCPTACTTALTQVTSHQSWPACTAACSDTDIVVSSVDRWARLCGARTESLIDQGKEAVKSLVSDGLTSRFHANVFLQFLLAILILVLGVGYGYRRGATSAQLAYQIQKIRLIGRKNSGTNLSV